MVKTVTYWSTLMAKAAAVGKAREAGAPPEEIAALEADLKAYEKACNEADEMVLDQLRKGDL